MKEKLIQLYLYGQAQDHGTRLAIAKQIKEYNKSAMIKDTITLNSIFEYMYPKYYAFLLSISPTFKLTDNFGIYLHNAFIDTGNCAYTLKYLEYYATNYPLQRFVSIAGDELEFIVAGASPGYTGHLTYSSLQSVDFANLLVTDFTLRKFNFIEKR